MALDRRRNPNRAPGEKPTDVDSRGNQLSTPAQGVPIAGDAPDEPSPEDLSESRERLYRQHLFSADDFARSAKEIEERGPSAVTDEEICRHGAYVSGAVFAAAAFLETSITDLYMELKKLSESHSNIRRELAMLPAFGRRSREHRCFTSISSRSPWRMPINTMKAGHRFWMLTASSISATLYSITLLNGMTVAANITGSRSGCRERFRPIRSLRKTRRGFPTVA